MPNQSGCVPYLFQFQNKNYNGCHFVCILQAAVSMLKQEYKTEGETTLQEAVGLAIKVLSKTLDMTKVTPEKSKYC